MKVWRSLRNQACATGVCCQRCPSTCAGWACRRGWSLTFQTKRSQRSGAGHHAHQAFGGFQQQGVVGHRRMHLGEVAAEFFFRRPVAGQAHGQPGDVAAVRHRRWQSLRRRPGHQAGQAPGRRQARSGSAPPRRPGRRRRVGAAALRHRPSRPWPATGRRPARRPRPRRRGARPQRARTARAGRAWRRSRLVAQRLRPEGRQHGQLFALVA